MEINVNEVILCKIFCLLISSSMLCAQYHNEVLKVLHNKNVEHVARDNAFQYDNIELGTVIFYFSQKPIVNFVPERSQDKKQAQKIFIFPKAVLKNSYNSQGAGYSLKIESIKLPIEGVKLSITYDPNIVDFDYNVFESIANEKGVVFNFYNKQLIEKIKNKEDSVLCIA